MTIAGTNDADIFRDYIFDIKNLTYYGSFDFDNPYLVFNVKLKEGTRPYTKVGILARDLSAYYLTKVFVVDYNLPWKVKLAETDRFTCVIQECDRVLLCSSFDIVDDYTLCLHGFSEEETAGMQEALIEAQLYSYRQNLVTGRTCTMADTDLFMEGMTDYTDKQERTAILNRANAIVQNAYTKGLVIKKTNAGDKTDGKITLYDEAGCQYEQENPGRYKELRAQIRELLDKETHSTIFSCADF